VTDETGSGRAQYDAAELEAMRAVVAKGTLPSCPRCSVTMTRRSIGGGSFGLGYARQREWMICPQCKRSAVFDVKRRTRN
jgi:transposase-like protein